MPLCEEFQFHVALERTFAFITSTNAYIEQRAPWKLGKSEDPADKLLLMTSLATMAEALRLGSTLLLAVIPSTVGKIQAVLGHEAGAVWQDELEWGNSLTGNSVAKTCILFPRPDPKA